MLLECAQPATPETILVVEDDAVLRQLFSVVLAHYGYEVLIAASAARRWRWSTDAPAGLVW
jgi:DNA-binding response OmpR family regulator